MGGFANVGEKHDPLPLFRGCLVSVAALPTLSQPLSLPFSSSYLPVDGVRLSQALLTAHLHMASRLQRLNSSLVKRHMSFREKHLAWRWLHDMMTPEDARALLHSAPLRPTWFTDLFGGGPPLLEAAVSSLIAETTSAARTGLRGTAQGQRQGGECCDGGLCYGFCSFFRALSAAVPAEQSWLRSPLYPLPDQADAPNHPLLVIRHFHDDAELQRQQTLLDEAGLRMALELAGAHQRRRKPPSIRLLASEPTEGDLEVGRRLHCPDPLFLDANNSPSPQSPLPSCSAPALPRVEESLSVQANSAFERLLGYSQTELREASVLYGEKALYGLFSTAAWPRVLELDKDIKLGRRREWSALVVSVSKRKSEVPCLLHCLSRFDDGGRVCVSYLTFMALPDASDGG